MASNHGNLYITLLALVLRVLRITHAEVNGTEEEKGGERIRERRREGQGRAGGGGTRKGTTKGEAGASGGGGSGGRDEKRSLLVGDV